MLYDDDSLLFVESRESRSHDSCRPISSAERAGAAWAAKVRRKEADLKCIKWEKLLRNTTAGGLWEKKCIIYRLCSFFMVIYSVIGKQYMMVWVAARGVTRGNCVGHRSRPPSPAHPLIGLFVSVKVSVWTRGGKTEGFHTQREAVYEGNN